MVNLFRLEDDDDLAMKLQEIERNSRLLCRYGKRVTAVIRCFRRQPGYRNR